MFNKEARQEKLTKGLQILVYFISFAILLSLAAFILLTVYEKNLLDYSWFSTVQLTTFLVFMFGQIAMVLVIYGVESLELFEFDSPPRGERALAFFIFFPIILLFKMLVLIIKFLFLSVVSHLFIIRANKKLAFVSWGVIVALVIATVIGFNVVRADQTKAAVRFVEMELGEKITSSQGDFTLSQTEFDYISEYVGQQVNDENLGSLDVCRAIVSDHMGELMAQGDIANLLQFVVNMSKHGFEPLDRKAVDIVFADEDFYKINEHISENGRLKEYVNDGNITYTYMGMEFRAGFDAIIIDPDGISLWISNVSHWDTRYFSYSEYAIVVGTEYKRENQIQCDR